ncbi:MAG: ferredoxin--NADP reductase [Thermodesulfobacteriota bacterium]
MPELNAVVTQRVELAPGLIVLRVKPEGWALPDFIAGQFTVLGLPGSAPRITFSDGEEPAPEPEKMIKRAYSIASSSVEKEYVEFYITLIRSGALTPRLFSLKVGDKLWMSQKFVGIFTLSQIEREDTGGNIILLATGTGIAPYMSMLRTELERGDSRCYAVVHGARHSWDLGYRAELRTMARICKNFNYVPVISRPDEEPAGWGGKAGYIQDVWTDDIETLFGFKPSPEDTHIFLCGNPAMIETMTDRLSSDGYAEHTKKQPGQIHTEKFW